MADETAVERIVGDSSTMAEQPTAVDPSNNRNGEIANATHQQPLHVTERVRLLDAKSTVPIIDASIGETKHRTLNDSNNNRSAENGTSPAAPVSNNNDGDLPRASSEASDSIDGARADDENDAEKCDSDPEHSRKSCDGEAHEAAAVSSVDASPSEATISSITMGTAIDSPDVAPSVDEAAATDATAEGVAAASLDSTKSPLAFTIDFGSGNGDRPVNSKKYNDIFARFQHRHRRGASLSKLEQPANQPAAPPATAKNNGLRKSASGAMPQTQTMRPNDVPVDPPVTMRDKTRLSRRDASVGSANRHSWSPRNSAGSSCGEEAVPQRTKKTLQPTPLSREPVVQPAPKPFQPKSATMQRAIDALKSKSEPHPSAVHCAAPPLELRLQKSASMSSVSEAGTYTLDGDNYTEEQKQQMSIDKMAKLGRTSTANATVASQDMHHPQQQCFIDDALRDAKPTKSARSTVSYLERIKSKVRNISDRTFHKQSTPPPPQSVALPELPAHMNAFASKQSQPRAPLDVGNFTSITAAGAFRKPSASDAKCAAPVGGRRRKPSLTRSQIDNSEYIQAAGGGSIIDQATLNSFTDYEKARHHDYQLNLFSNLTTTTTTTTIGDESQQLQQQLLLVESVPSSPRHHPSLGGTASASEFGAEFGSSVGEAPSSGSSYGIETAETKNDWIQEWAKNARRNNRKAAAAAAAANVAYNPANHPSAAAAVSSPLHQPHTTAHRPPVSPTKIPSPMHTLSRRRSMSVNRSLHSSTNDLDSTHGGTSSPYHDTTDTDVYLHKTAAAISQLQHLQRNSPQHKPPTPTSFHHTVNSPTGTLRQPQHNVRGHDDALEYQQQQQHHANLPYHHHHHQYQQQYGSSTSLNNVPLSPRHYQHHVPQQFVYQPQQQHRRNHSMDYAANNGPTQRQPPVQHDSLIMSQSYTSGTANARRQPFSRHVRHNSYENEPQPSALPTPINRNVASQHQQQHSGDYAAAADHQHKHRSKSATVTPTTIKRSSSFSTKPFQRPQSSPMRASFMSPKNGAQQPRTAAFASRAAAATAGGLQKSASSNSFQNAAYGIEDYGIYLNDNDDLHAGGQFSSDSEASDAPHSASSAGYGPVAGRHGTAGSVSSNAEPLITNTRYNRAFLARLEQNRPKNAGGNSTAANSMHPAANGAGKQGVMACPNTPEMPRRDMRARASMRDRASMPRDSSIQRMKLESNIVSLSATKRGLINGDGGRPAAAAVASSNASPAATSRVLPKYLDISKYKPTQGNAFLRRDESKSTLVAQPARDHIKRSTSAFGVTAGNRSEAPGRSSVRSVKSSTSAQSMANGRPTMALKDEAARETDLAMWRRRASYDPMKAAAEGKRKLEARKAANAGKPMTVDGSPAMSSSKSCQGDLGQMRPLQSLAYDEQTAPEYDDVDYYDGDDRREPISRASSDDGHF